MDVIEVDGLRVAYERAGAGPSLLLLHGYVGDGLTTWQRQIDGLCDEFTVVAWDAPGAGGSSDPPESFGMAGCFPTTAWPPETDSPIASQSPSAASHRPLLAKSPAPEALIHLPRPTTSEPEHTSA
jgi:pimeloyl-ACP methyl ester carboxylesterase